MIVRDLDPIQQQEIILVENLQRQDLSAVEEARAYRRLLDGGHTTAQVARRIGVPSARINARLVLLKLDEQVQWMFDRGDLPLTLATVLLKVADPIRQRQVATMAARRQLTVPEIERIVERGVGALQTAPPRTSLPPDEPEKQGLSPSRVVALGNLAKHASTRVSLAEVADLFQATCCACGAEDLPTYCSACPMLELVDRVLARANKWARWLTTSPSSAGSGCARLAERSPTRARRSTGLLRAARAVHRSRPASQRQPPCLFVPGTPPPAPGGRESE